MCLGSDVVALEGIAVVRSRSLALLGLFALVAVACGGGDPVDVGADPDGNGDAAPDEQTEGGTLIAAIGGDPDQLDPHATTSSFAFTVLENVYDTLVQPGDDLTMEPALAESWDTSDDLLTWVFTLREGVTFHDGSELTSEDVVASFEHIRDEGANGWRLAAIDEFEATDDLTVTMRLNRPAPNLLEQIGPFKGLAIASADDIAAGTLNDEPNGTGPFRLTDSSGDSITLEAFEDYWGEGPFLDGIEFRIIPDEGVKLTNLETGEVDWIDSVPPEQVETLEGSDDLVIGRTPGNDYWYLSLNNDREPFDDPQVRQAIAFALDPEVIAEAAHFDAATPNETAIPEDSFWYHEYAPFGYDPDQARQLLEDAGVEGLTIDLMVTNEFPETVTAAQVIENQLGEVGISVSIRTEDFATWLGGPG
jgi:peptide/nickel transport system substrate-binding protein